MGSIILDGAEIGEGAFIGAGSFVPPGKKIPPNSCRMGSVQQKLYEQLTDVRQEQMYNASFVSMLKKDNIIKVITKINY